jgi:GTPase
MSVFLVNRIKDRHPKLYVINTRDDNIVFDPERDDGHIEYKRTLADCNETKSQKYATQMRWRISENVKTQSATYYIGIDDDGSIIGLEEDEIIECVNRFVDISKTIGASISGINLINVKEKIIMRINVKIKKIIDNYNVEFGDKF